MVAAIWVATWHYFIQHREASVVSVVIAFSIGVFVAARAVHRMGRIGTSRRPPAAQRRTAQRRRDASSSSARRPAGGGGAAVHRWHGCRRQRGDADPDRPHPRRSSSVVRSRAAASEDEAMMNDTWTRLRNGEVLPSPVFAVPNVDGTSVMVEADVRAPRPAIRSRRRAAARHDGHASSAPRAGGRAATVPDRVPRRRPPAC